MKITKAITILAICTLMTGCTLGNTYLRSQHGYFTVFSKKETQHRDFKYEYRLMYHYRYNGDYYKESILWNTDRSLEIGDEVYLKKR